MAESNNDALMAYAMGQDNGRCNNNNGGWGDGWMVLIAFAMIFGGWGGGGPPGDRRGLQSLYRCLHGV